MSFISLPSLSLLSSLLDVFFFCVLLFPIFLLSFSICVVVDEWRLGSIEGFCKVLKFVAMKGERGELKVSFQLEFFR